MNRETRERWFGPPQRPNEIWTEVEQAQAMGETRYEFNCWSPSEANLMWLEDNGYTVEIHEQSRAPFAITWEAMNAAQALGLTRKALPPLRPDHILLKVKQCAMDGKRRYALQGEECNEWHQWWLIENGYTLESISPTTSVGRSTVIAIEW